MLKFRPSPALAVAALALFIALGGVGVAATQLLPSNSVGTAQIQNNSVTRAKIAHQSITSVLIKPGSLMASDFATGQIPAGPKGNTGAAGAQGPRGATGPAGPTGSVGVLKVETQAVAVLPGRNASVTVIDAKHQAIAAGTSWQPDEDGLLVTVSIHPVIGDSGKLIGYQGRAYNGTLQTHVFQLHVSFG